jgi:hypothetical protein
LKLVASPAQQCTGLKAADHALKLGMPVGP